ncbi:hypothetical protein KAX17_17440 [Candidatus Bipolaricaulota bacterium]|nr:hypothetical protein [Candidatus Bipolaricaulota bacterium]
MKDMHKQLLEQVVEMAEEGKFGESIKAVRKEYEQLPVGIATLLKCVTDAYADKHGINKEILQLRDLFCQLLVATYRDAARREPDVALALVHSLIRDYPGVPESCLAPQFCALMQAALSFRELAYSKNRLLVWQQMSRLVLAYNEFLNALLGYLIPCIRCSRGKEPNAKIFSMPYSARVKELNALTGGENGPFYLITRLARPKIRNAIAHGTIWLDSKAAMVRYPDGPRKRKSEIDLLKFGALALSGSHLAEPYLAAAGTIAVMEDGSELARQFLPAHLVRVFNFSKGEI